MLPSCLRLPVALCAALAALASSAPAQQAIGAPAQPRSTFVADGLGKGAVALDGPWQFHLGDDMAWANPVFDDSQWEQLSADRPWGAQGHKGYTGIAWYRRRIAITLAPGASPDLALYLPAVNDAYEVYWNGALVGRYGRLPPDPVWYYLPPPQTMGLGQARSGVLALRVWKAPLTSNDSVMTGGFSFAPSIGSPAAIAGLKALPTACAGRLQVELRSPSTACISW
jgi:hypothetical protein